jgi:hypothetical protein
MSRRGADAVVIALQVFLRRGFARVATPSPLLTSRRLVRFGMDAIDVVSAER